MSKRFTIKKYDEAFQAFCNRDLIQSMYSECKVLMEKVLLTLHGKEHTTRRGMELKLFRRNYVRYYLQEVYPKTLNTILVPHVERGKADLIEFAYRVNMHLSCDFAGIDHDYSDRQQTNELMGIIRKCGEGATLFHSVRDKDKVRAEVKTAIDALDQNYLQASIARRKALLAEFEQGEIAEEDLPRDILMILLQNQKSSGMSDELLRRETAFFLQAGPHSTANASVHSFHEITQWCKNNPEDRQRIQQDPIFLQRCVHESLRLHPASPAAWRSVGCPMSMDKKPLTEGDSVMIDMHQANRDEDIFGEDAHLFNPHRTIKDRYPPYGLTFGVGVHTCFGLHLAGGLLPKGKVDPVEHQYGIVTSLLRGLFEAGASPDPDAPPQADDGTDRANWSNYPIVFNK